MSSRRSRKSSHGAPRIAVVAVLAAAALVFAGAVATRAHFNHQVASATQSAAKSSGDIDYDVDYEAGNPLSVMVVGDSYTGGSDMNSGPTWAEQMTSENGWNFIRESASGIGYLAGNPSRPAEVDRVSQQLADYAPDVVLLALGHNDANHYPTGEIVDAAVKVVRELVKGEPDAEIVVLSPFTGGGDNPGIAELTPALGKAIEALGVTYIDTSDYIHAAPKLLGSDGTHPTDAGHTEIAKRLTADLEAAGVTIRKDDA